MGGGNTDRDTLFYRCTSCLIASTPGRFSRETYEIPSFYVSTVTSFATFDESSFPLHDTAPSS